MGKYHYDETGNLAAIFVLTFLAIVLIPLTLSFSPSSEKKITQGCQCTPCQEQRARIRKREKASIFNPKLGAKSLFTIGGWALFAFLAYKVGNSVVENKVYDPFEILGIRSSLSEKEIRSHYKKLSKKFHPDKVKVEGNDTIESIAARFVDFTKAYKALTDDTIRENLVKFGHPDGQQETSMGIALPPWIVEGHNNIWVLGAYGLIFGIALPMLVGRWWFGTQRHTKDGVHARTAAAFFKTLKEESDVADVVGALGKAAEWDERPGSAAQQGRLDVLEEAIQGTLGRSWTEVRKIAEASGNEHNGRKKALVLLYAHLLRLSVDDASLQKDQTAVLLQTPTLLNALLSVSMSRNWLAPTLAIMRLHAYFAQALPPRRGLEAAQLPRVAEEEAAALGTGPDALSSAVEKLGAKGDVRAEDARKALERWGRLELVDVAFKVIDERIVTPSSIVYLVVKLRITPPGASTAPVPVEEDVEAAKKRSKAEEARDYTFLTDGKKDAEDLPQGASDGWAHAPFWPAHRRTGWWLVLADEKSNRVVVPPMKVSEVPFARTTGEPGHRAYKLQFQAPQGVGIYTWKVCLVSDTFVGEEVERSVALKVEEPTADDDAEDEISDPEEDSLAGQMAALRGGPVKQRGPDEESDDESGTDDDEESDSDSSSSSDDD